VVHWQDMALVEPTVRGYRAYRREVPASGQPAAFAEVKAKDSLLSRNELVDTGLAAGKAYEYAARSIDRFGGQSDLSSVARVTITGPQAVQPPQGLSCRPLDGAALVSWSPTLQPGLTGLKLYRFERGKKPTLVATLATGAIEYLDKAVGKGKLYFYYLTVTSASGQESAPSVEVGIRP
jgi:fibronectin type 3 domain-containing protein